MHFIAINIRVRVSPTPPKIDKFLLVDFFIHCESDVSLLKPLCELLNISVNELLLGEKIPEDNYRKKVEDNTIRILEECRFSLESGRYFENT